MKNKTKSLIAVCISALFCACHNNTINGNKSKGTDTVFFQLSGSTADEEQLFNYVKTSEWKPVYVFQIDDEDDYGHIRWRNFWIVNDFTKEEFEEMKKYADVRSFLEKCPTARTMYTKIKVNK
jgi:hypothetical protein